YPNPFNPTTTIKYLIPSTVISNERSDVRNLRDFSSQAPRNDNVHVTLKVYDILGREVAILVNKEQSPGNYEVQFDASSVSRRITSGIYYYRLSAGNLPAGKAGFVETKKMILIK
ncbi:MAG: hypothetical protein KAQ90_05280, partial [Melioribacteraceae bacterium]|nr:hypothetical protein [Melioribacteraceae bacterium]